MVLQSDAVCPDLAASCKSLLQGMIDGEILGSEISDF